MRPQDKKIIEGRINRLRVFAAVKAAMEADGQCPFASDIASRLGLNPAVVSRHMVALANADGLPFPIPSGKLRKSGALSEQSIGEDDRQTLLMEFRRSGRADPATPIEVDHLFNR